MTKNLLSLETMFNVLSNLSPSLADGIVLPLKTIEVIIKQQELAG